LAAAAVSAVLVAWVGLSPAARDFQVALAVSVEDLWASIFPVSSVDCLAALVLFQHSVDDLVELDSVCQRMVALLVAAGLV